MKNEYPDVNFLAAIFRDVIQLEAIGHLKQVHRNLLSEAELLKGRKYAAKRAAILYAADYLSRHISDLYPARYYKR